MGVSPSCQPSESRSTARASASVTELLPRWAHAASAQPARRAASRAASWSRVRCRSRKASAAAQPNSCTRSAVVYCWGWRCCSWRYSAWRAGMLCRLRLQSRRSETRAAGRRAVAAGGCPTAVLHSIRRAAAAGPPAGVAARPAGRAAALATQRAAGGGPCGAATRRCCCRTWLCAQYRRQPCSCAATMVAENKSALHSCSSMVWYRLHAQARMSWLGAVGGADAAHVHAADAQGGPSPPAVPALSRLWHRPCRGRLEGDGGAVGAGGLSGSAGRRGACPGRCAGRGPCAHQCWAATGRVWRQAVVPDQQ